MPTLLLPRRHFVSYAAVLLFVSLSAVHACGPDWTPDVFVRRYRPDLPKEFYTGKLGVLEETYYRYSLIPAYRYLNGGVLSAEEKVPLDPASPWFEESAEETRAHGEAAAQSDDQSAQARWLAARNAITAVKIELIYTFRRVPSSKPNQSYDFFENCNDSAFDTATDTLEARAAAWGPQSANTAAWIGRQDQVFRNCDGRSGISIPTPADAGSPKLLQQDSLYQQAAANFYALQFDLARQQFKAISEDASSPWHGLAAYLVARTTVRQAMLVPVSADDIVRATFDKSLLETAESELEALKKNPFAPVSAVEHELQFVQAKIDPIARIRDASLALAGPKPDPDFQRDLTDLVLLLHQRMDRDLDFEDSESTGEGDRKLVEKKATNAFAKTSDLRGAAPMVDWLITFQSRTEGARQHALSQWTQTQSLPWLVAAITKTESRDASAPELMEAAAKVPQSSPAWQTVTYHRARLLAASKPKDARALLDSTLSVVQNTGPTSADNRFTALRMTVATSFNDFLKYAPRHDQLAENSENGASLRGCKTCDKKIAALQFAPDAAGFFNRQAPLSAWLEASKTSELPDGMRHSLVLSGWTRAVVLNDSAATRAFANMLPSSLRNGQVEEPGFAAWLGILRNPGLRFYLDGGIQRSQSAMELDEFHNNWWCGQWTGPRWDAPSSTVPATFLSSAQVAEAQAQFTQLLAVGNAPAWLGRRVIEYAKAHPDDSNVPEALYRVVRSTRYGCSYDEQGSDKAVSFVSAEAFRILHRNYPHNPWTKKTPYHF